MRLARSVSLPVNGQAVTTSPNLAVVSDAREAPRLLLIDVLGAPHTFTFDGTKTAPGSLLASHVVHSGVDSSHLTHPWGGSVSVIRIWQFLNAVGAILLHADRVIE